MNRVTVVMPWRDGERYAAASIQRVLNLDLAADQWRVVCVEGDSVDDTWGRLETWEAQDPRVRLVKCDTGKPRYGSVINADRFAGLAQVFNAGLEAVDLTWSTHGLMLPSDIVYRPALLARLLAHGADLVAPMVWLGDVFYDTFAFVRDGRHWPNFRRDELARYAGDALIQMDSVGGVLLMRAEVLRAGCRYSPVDVDRGLCRAARERGFRVWADPTTQVEHPAWADMRKDRPGEHE